jgi:hypothetical protein
MTKEPVKEFSLDKLIEAARQAGAVVKKCNPEESGIYIDGKKADIKDILDSLFGAGVEE